MCDFLYDKQTIGSYHCNRINVDWDACYTYRSTRRCVMKSRSTLFLACFVHVSRTSFKKRTRVNSTSWVCTVTVQHYEPRVVAVENSNTRINNFANDLFIASFYDRKNSNVRLIAVARCLDHEGIEWKILPPAVKIIVSVPGPTDMIYDQGSALTNGRAVGVRTPACVRTRWCI